MILRYWDPAIREEERLMGRLESEIGIGDGNFQGYKAEDGNLIFSFDFGWFGLITVTMKMGSLRQLRIIEIRILISILIKKKSIRYEGIIFISFSLINHGFGDKETSRKEN
ncbi:hypothetical protein DY000_02021230 [Brassica cretica]|uniref:Uncharacterized protein n=1 Tax=Brassica cretica TaxID=69181 RepID=A0ABQ7E552_BRACR|nr:hypothetical protein DY000_02021230 [Brassica cretica]